MITDHNHRRCVNHPACSVLAFLAVMLVQSMPAAAASAKGNPAGPNIILIMADDLGAECLRCYGSTSYQTPHLDALAETGIRFEHCYSTPLCSPSRVQLMTGRYPFRTGWTNLIDRAPEKMHIFDPRKETTFGHLLRGAGYATALAGKWQLAHFDEVPDHVRQCGFDEYCCWCWKLRNKATDRYWDPCIWQDGRRRENLEGEYGPDVFCDFIVDFLERNRDRPFFVYYPMALTHAPFLPTPDSRKATAAGDGTVAADVPVGRGSRDFPKNGRLGGSAATKRTGVPGPETASRKATTASDDKNANNHKNFAAMVAHMDRVVGRIVAALDRLGLRENTLLLFTGDNGTDRSIMSKRGDTLIRGGKSKLTDCGTHVPLIANWKGTSPAGRVCDDLIDFSDFMPTIAGLARTGLPDDVTIDGCSFVPQLLGQPGKPRQWVYIQLTDRYCVRDKRWKLYHDGRLYDLQRDPTEQRPIGADTGSPAATSARQRLQAVLQELRK